MSQSEMLGFLQLCAERRYHRKTMEEFERATGLQPDEYWIEATAGGAPAFGAASATAAFSFANGATIMGWAAHGDACGGFPGRSDFEIRTKLQAMARERTKDFPEAEHWMLFASKGRVEVTHSF